MHGAEQERFQRVGGKDLRETQGDSWGGGGESVPISESLKGELSDFGDLTFCGKPFDLILGFSIIHPILKRDILFIHHHRVPVFQ